MNCLPKTPLKSIALFASAVALFAACSSDNTTIAEPIETTIVGSGAVTEPTQTPAAPAATPA